MLIRDDVELARALERCEVPSRRISPRRRTCGSRGSTCTSASIDQAIDADGRDAAAIRGSVGQRGKVLGPDHRVLDAAARGGASRDARRRYRGRAAAPTLVSWTRISFAARGFPCHYVWFRRFIGRRTGSACSSPICVTIRSRRVNRTSSHLLATSGPATIAELHRGLAHKRSTLTEHPRSPVGSRLCHARRGRRRSANIRDHADRQGLQIAKRVHRHLSDLEEAVARRVTGRRR